MAYNYKKRITIIPEMIPDIIDTYDKYYNGGFGDATLKDIGEYLNNTFEVKFKKKFNLDESAYRKTYKNIKDGIDIGIKEGTSDAEIAKIAKAKNDLQIQKRIANKQRQEANNSLRVLADNEIIKEAIKETIGCDFFDNDFIEIKLNNNINNEKGQAIYCLSDIHYGYNCDIINNYYNDKIADERIKKFFEFVYNDVKKNGYKEIYISDCGDMIEGSTLRISQLVNITELIIEQSIHYVEIISSCLLELTKKLKDVMIRYSCITDANHQQLRHFSGKPNEYSNEDFGLIIYHLLNEKLKGYNKLDINGGDIIFVNVDNMRIAFAHGHQFGKLDGINYIKKVFNTDVDCVVQGHWHSFNVENYNLKFEDNIYKQQYIVTLPAVCGNTDYAVRKGYSSIPAGLKLLIKDSKINSMELIYLI